MFDNDRRPAEQAAPPTCRGRTHHFLSRLESTVHKCPALEHSKAELAVHACPFQIDACSISLPCLAGRCGHEIHWKFNDPSGGWASAGIPYRHVAFCEVSLINALSGNRPNRTTGKDPDPGWT